MKELLKNYKILILAALVLVSIGSLAFNGLQFGIDFKGGTLFQIHLAQTPTASQLSTITTIIQQRIDSFGLKDTSLKSFGQDFVIAQIAETDPSKVEQLEVLIKTQGKFESILDGQVLFTGSDIVQIIKDPAQGYGFFKEQSGLVTWILPFRLNQEAAVRFSKGVFHKCEVTSFSVQQGSQFDCKSTYFFIDRPSNSFLVLTKDVFENDRQLLLLGNQQQDISQGTDIEELLNNSSLSHFIVEESLSQEQREEIQKLSMQEAIVHPQVPVQVKEELKEAGFKVRELQPTSTSIPWVWTASGAKQSIALTPGITGVEPFIADIENAQVFSDLVITGTSGSFEQAEKSLNDLTILLETGSLPIPIDSVSKETISPFLGKEFLDASLLIGLVSLVVVALVVFVRYKNFKIAIPIIVTGASEVILLLGLASIVRINLDLAAVAGILAVVGTGVDHQIIITDELLRGEHASAESLTARIKKAFFIIIAAALTSVATMLPIIFFGFGLGKLLGFAVTTIAGVLIGVIITRPAFAEIAKSLIKE